MNDLERGCLASPRFPAVWSSKAAVIASHMNTVEEESRRPISYLDLLISTYQFKEKTFCKQRFFIYLFSFFTLVSHFTSHWAIKIM